MKLIDDVYYYQWTSLTENNCNSYIIDGEVRTLIDPGHKHLFSHVHDGAGEDGVPLEDLDLIIGTHSHPDHIEAVVNFNQQPVKFALHGESEKYLEEIGPAFYQAAGQSMPEFRVDFNLREGDLHLGSKTFQIFHTPGHEPGSVCIYWPDKKVLITGDVIFSGGLGRTDFPKGNANQLKESIRRLMDLEVEYLLPGHGDIIQGKDNVSRNFARVEAMYFSYM